MPATPTRVPARSWWGWRSCATPGTCSNGKDAMIASSPSAEGFRLSAQRERLWLLCSGGLPLEARAAISVVGDLDPEILRQSLERVVERHEILRTGFHRLAGVAIPLQVIAAEAARPPAHPALSAPAEGGGGG